MRFQELGCCVLFVVAFSATFFFPYKNGRRRGSLGSCGFGTFETISMLGFFCCISTGFFMILMIWKPVFADQKKIRKMEDIIWCSFLGWLTF